VLSYLAAHAEIYRQDYDGDRVTIRCHLPRHLLYHIQGPDVEVRSLENHRAV
jgi:GTP-binding protein HflX